MSEKRSKLDDELDAITRRGNQRLDALEQQHRQRMADLAALLKPEASLLKETKHPYQVDEARLSSAREACIKDYNLAYETIKDQTTLAWNNAIQASCRRSNWTYALLTVGLTAALMTGLWIAMTIWMPQGF